VVLPAVQRCGAPTVILSLQPAPTADYEEIDTQEWLASDTGCCVPEIAGVFKRAGIPVHVIAGLLEGDRSTDRQLEEWVRAATVARTLYYARLGFLGNTYPGMLDLCSDVTMHQAQLGCHVEILEMCELKKRVDRVPESTVDEWVERTVEMFDIHDDRSKDPIASPPTPEQLRWSARVAKGLESLFEDFDLTTLAYYYRGLDDNEYERIGAGLILGNTFLTSHGYPCATEGDLKTTVGMLILDCLGAGGNFSEIVALDYEGEFLLLGHDGPGHIEITGHRPILRGLGLYHGKRGSGVSVEFNVKPGPVTILGVTQTMEGRLKLVAAEGEAVPGEILRLGNCNTRVRFDLSPGKFLEAWSGEGPTHHFALGLGHHIGTLEKVSQLIGVELARVC
jgi:L-arabinose isomerase